MDFYYDKYIKYKQKYINLRGRGGVKNKIKTKDEIKKQIIDKYNKMVGKTHMVEMINTKIKNKNISNDDVYKLTAAELENGTFYVDINPNYNRIIINHYVGDKKYECKVYIDMVILKSDDDASHTFYYKNYPIDKSL